MPMAGFNKNSSGERKRLYGCLKRTRKNHHGSGRKDTAESGIFSLPDELLSQILAHVAGNSLIDLFNAASSCKAFKQLASDKFVLQHACVEQIQPIPKPAKYLFFESCMKSGNPEALYKRGVVELVTDSDLESGFAYLDKATNSGHLGALYILGVLLVCEEDDESNRRGMQLLSNICKAKRVGQCRKKFQDNISCLWRNYHPKPRLKKTCPWWEYHGVQRGWPRDVDDIDLSCETCICHREVNFVCNSLCGHDIYG